MSEFLIMLVASEAKLAINPADSLEDRCRAAMKVAWRHWMVTDEDFQFKGAVTGVYLATEDEDERERIRIELESLRAVAAMLDGLPINLDAVELPENPIGLRSLWMEIAHP